MSTHSASSTFLQKRTFAISGLSCAACSSSVESILSHTIGVHSASVNLSANTVKIEWDEQTTPDEMHSILANAGYELILDSEDVTLTVKEEQAKQALRMKKRTLGAAALTLPVFLLGMLAMDWEPGRWISMGLSIPVLFVFGRDFYSKAWKQLKGKKASMDTLVALSTSIAFFFSAFSTVFPDYWHSRGIHPPIYFEAATVIVVFILLGKLLEEQAKAGTTESLQKLMGLQPKTLKVLRLNEEQEIKIEEVRLGDVILIRPGEKIPVDGTVKDGESYVNESLLSGEPTPVLKKVDEKVFAGTINQKGSFQYVAQRIGKDTLLAQIIDRVREAQGSKAPIQKLVDQVASIFVPTVLLIAIATFFTWFWLGENEVLSHALLTSVSVLVIACPCALGLATPTAIMVGMGKGAENQILIKDAESLELGHRVNAVILDKTGTITEGKPTVANFHSIIDCNSVLLSLESKSGHPLAEAVIDHLNKLGVEKVNLDDFESITGRGVKAKYEGRTYFAGNQSLLKENKIQISIALEKTSQSWSQDAQTIIWFADEERVLAILGIKDQIKPSSKSAIQRLLADGMEVYLLTGDNYQTAATVARQVGISNFQAEMLPSDKSSFVKNLQAQGKIVAMVGDGINDSEALAQADVSIAMGHGSDIAMDVAKMTLITSDLEKVPQAFKLSSLTVNGIRQNLFWAFIYNLIGIPIAAGVLYPISGFLLDPMIAGAAMAFSSVSVVLNSLRLKSKTL